MVIDPDVPFKNIAEQQWNHYVIEANDGGPRQTAQMRDACSVPAVGTKRKDAGAAWHDTRDGPNTAGVKEGRTRRTAITCPVCLKQGHKQLDCPKASRARRGKVLMARTKGRLPQSSSLKARSQITAGTNSPAHALRHSAIAAAAGNHLLGTTRFKTRW